MVAIVHFSPQVWEGGGRVHLTETWIVASEDPDHDFDFHLHALGVIADHYLRGDGSAATATARGEHRTPRMHMFTDGCAKLYKGRRNFRFLSDSVRQVGFIIEHHFAATSHFKGCHDGIGGVAENAMRNSELRDVFVTGADGVVRFLEGYFRHIGGKTMQDYFATWSPYRIRRVHVKLIGPPPAIYRPKQDLKGIEGTHSTYLFVGANAGRCDAPSTTCDMEKDLAAAAEIESGKVGGTGLSVLVAGPWEPGKAKKGDEEEEEEEGKEEEEGEEEEEEEEEKEEQHSRRGSRVRKRIAKAMACGSDDEAGGEEEQGGGSRRGSWVRKRSAKAMACDSDEEEKDEEDENDGGWGEEEEDSEEEAEVGSGEGGSEEEGPVSGEEPAVCVGKVVLNHKLYTCLASCFCSACQLRQYDGCYTHSMYPGLVPNFEVGVVQETVVMDTGVAPAGDGK